MHEFWTIPIAKITYTRSQHYINMVVGEHRIQIFEFVVVVNLLLVMLSFDVFVPSSAPPLLFLIKWLVQYT